VFGPSDRVTRHRETDPAFHGVGGWLWDRRPPFTATSSNAVGAHFGSLPAINLKTELYRRGRNVSGCYAFAQALYSARNASTGEMRLVRSAGTREATNADNPSVATATNVTEGLNGFTP
jgi:hypothetical protein